MVDGNHAGQMDRLFRQTGLMRAKWDDARGAETYGERTISKAIERTPTPYQNGATDTVPVVETDPNERVIDSDDDLAPPDVPSDLYAFEHAFGPDHFVSEWIAHHATLTDAAYEYHEAAALVALAVCTPGLSVKLSFALTGLHTNLYILFLGGTSITRKSTSARYVVDMLRHLDPGSVLSDASSHQGLVQGLSERAHAGALQYADEWTHTLADILHAKHLAGMQGVYLEMYGKTHYVYSRVKKRNRDGELKDDKVTVKGTTFSVLGCCTETIFSSITSAEVGSGLLPRFAIVNPERKPPRKPVTVVSEEQQTTSVRLQNRLREIESAAHGLTVEITPDAMALLNAFDAELYARGGGGSMAERLTPMAYKVSMLASAGRLTEEPVDHAALLGDGPTEPVTPPRTTLEVTLSDAVSAVAVVRRWMAYARRFESNMAPSRDEVTCRAHTQGPQKLQGRVGNATQHHAADQASTASCQRDPGNPHRARTD